ncbi:MAG: hypothetical protein HYS39_01845 [Proteobacteria bacterium]|nr:hypothetical protein [Pseudomonadota bacterium]
MAAIHETMEALYDIGAIDRYTMHQFDEAYLTLIRTLTPEELQNLLKEAF